MCSVSLSHLHHADLHILGHGYFQELLDQSIDIFFQFGDLKGYKLAICRQLGSHLFLLFYLGDFFGAINNEIYF